MTRGECPIAVVNSTTYLGVLLSSDLTWSAHINATCSKAKQRLGFLYRHFHLASTTTLCHLYKSLVLPILDYCSSVWDPYQITYIHQLESVQKFAARLATKNWKGNYVSLLRQVKWPSLLVRRKKHKVSVCHRILFGYSIIHPSVFTPHTCPHLRHSHCYPLHRPNVRTLSHQSSFVVSGIPLWNSLPPDIAEASSTLSFKLRLKRSLVFT